MNSVRIGAGAVVRNAILDKEVVVPAGRRARGRPGAGQEAWVHGRGRADRARQGPGLPRRVREPRPVTTRRTGMRPRLGLLLVCPRSSRSPWPGAARRPRPPRPTRPEPSASEPSMMSAGPIPGARVLPLVTIHAVAGHGLDAGDAAGHARAADAPSSSSSRARWCRSGCGARCAGPLADGGSNVVGAVVASGCDVPPGVVVIVRRPGRRDDRRPRGGQPAARVPGPGHHRGAGRAAGRVSRGSPHPARRRPTASVSGCRGTRSSKGTTSTSCPGSRLGASGTTWCTSTRRTTPATRSPTATSSPGHGSTGTRRGRR